MYLGLKKGLKKTLKRLPVYFRDIKNNKTNLCEDCSFGIECDSFLWHAKTLCPIYFYAKTLFHSDFSDDVKTEVSQKINLKNFNILNHEHIKEEGRP